MMLTHLVRFNAQQSDAAAIYPELAKSVEGWKLTTPPMFQPSKGIDV